MKKIRTIVVDTLTATQTDEWMTSKKKPGHNEWMDFGKSIYQFMIDLQELGFELVLVLGSPGTGKSSGMRTLEPGTNIWYNADNKNPVWEGGREEYGKKHNPKAPYHVIPKSYKDIITHIKSGLEQGMFEEERVAFLTGHTETYKEGMDTKVRLKTLGKVATNMQLEGKLETVLYTQVDIEDSKPVYKLQTQNNGYNTARSHQNMFEPIIPNDYNFVLKKLLEY